MESDIREVKGEELFPQLDEIPEPPERLWMRGTLPKPGTKYLAVVGSRAMTSYGKEACAKLIEGLRGYPISIVSGLALGVDGEAHKSALRAGLHTIAIPGSGLGENVIYPRSHLGLAHDILKAGGALLSEHPENYQPAQYDFPSRNRIMVGIADAVLIIEAGAQSGTLITARLTSEYNRELLCVPHRIGDPHSFGAHLFIRLGATLVAESAHILEALSIPFARSDTEREEPKLTGNEKIIYDMLSEPLARDELIRIVHMPPQEALSVLVTLELKGILKEEFGAWRRA